MRSLRAYSWFSTSSNTFRSIALLLVLIEAGLVIPLTAQQRATVAPTKDPLKGKPLPAPKVKVNRTVPKVDPPRELPAFSAVPTNQEIFRARTFSEPLLPVGESTGEQNRLLSEVILSYVKKGIADDIAPFESYLTAHPSSAWRASILANLGTVYRRTGRISKALETYTVAWNLAKDATGPERGVADYAMGQSLEMLANLGQADMIEAQLKLVGEYVLRGPAGSKYTMARFTLSQLRAHPTHVIPSGPLALERIGLVIPGGLKSKAPIEKYEPKAEGMSLLELRALAAKAGVRGVAAVRIGNVPPVVPSIVHLKFGHFSAVVREDAERQRYLVEDPALGGVVWMTADALREETSGFALIPASALPAGWREASESELLGIIGRSCPPGGPSPESPPGCPDCPPPGQSCCGKGMPIYRFHPVTAALILSDIPLDYQPEVGPGINFELFYNSRESLLPQTFAFSNFGAHWSFDWLSYAEERLASCGIINNGCVPDHVFVLLRGGGGEPYLGPPDLNGAYPTHYRARATLVKVSTSPIRYERRLPDGGVEVFGQPDGAPAGQRRVFLTEVRDPQGHTLQFTYDSQFRLSSLTDALGQVTTLSYEFAGDPLKITKVTDPFGRFASFQYSASGQLTSITDVIGLTSSFVYGPSDLVVAMTTPYGTTTFRHEADPSGYFTNPMIEATDPLGGTERLEYRWETTLPATEPAAVVPSGFTSANSNLNRYVTLYWNKRAWMLFPGDDSKAVQTHWLLHGEYPGIDVLRSVPVPHSVKQPLESRVWYAYPNQPTPEFAGSHASASREARVMDDGTTQTWEKTFNTMGQPTSVTDPRGRQTSVTYSTDGMNPLEVRQTTGALNDLLATYSNYTSQNLPQTVTDAAGQSKTTTYNTDGQVLTSTNAKNETTTFVYETGTKRLLSVTGPLTGATTTYTYDAYGRVRTVSDSDGYITTTDYDAMDRPIRVTYPDSTYEELTYDRLNIGTRRDRMGRITRLFYNAAGQVASVRDPQGRVVRYEWCACGMLDALVDSGGNRTSWERDSQGRVVKEIRADSSETSYVYETMTSRLKRRTDPGGQHTDYLYFADDRVQQISYPNATIPTATVAFIYEGSYNRLLTITDGSGATTVTYRAPGTLGAGQISTVDGPFDADVITYLYDELGRVTTQRVNGSANEVTWTFDELDRVTSQTNLYGATEYTYDGLSRRLETVTYPNNQSTSYTYFANAGDHRLQTILNKYPNGSTLSRFDYTYDAGGNVLTWRQQGDADSVMWEYGYDLASQLTRAVKKSTDVTPVVLKRFGYAYDSAANRIAEQVDDSVAAATFDRMNRLTSQAPGGLLRFEGTVSEVAAVTIDGKPADVTSGGRFVGRVPVADGTPAVTIVATDPSGNSATAIYDLFQNGSTRTFSYDANGNLTSDGARTFEWDARNQLVAVNDGLLRREFVYDGVQRRIGARLKVNGVLQDETKTVWCGTRICEDRAADGVTVMRRSFGEIEQAGSTSLMVSRDHLGNPAELVSASGSLVSRYAFDPWGRRTLVTGSDQSKAGFAGQEWDESSGLSMTRYRAYMPETGRWASEDPAGLDGGMNLYRYADGDPVRNIDPTGLVSLTIGQPSIQYLPKSQIGGCGKTQARIDLKGSCKCVNGSWRASLSITLTGTMKIANDTWVTSQKSIIAHERAHWDAFVAAAHQAKAAGERIESTSYKSKGECDGAVRAWQREWYPKIDNSGAHNAYSSWWNSFTCR